MLSQMAFSTLSCVLCSMTSSFIPSTCIVVIQPPLFFPHLKWSIFQKERSFSRCNMANICLAAISFPLRRATFTRLRRCFRRYFSPDARKQSVCFSHIFNLTKISLMDREKGLRIYCFLAARFRSPLFLCRPCQYSNSDW